MNKNLKIVFTFGIATRYKGNVVIIECNNIMQAIKYVFNKYGNLNVAFDYHYNEESLKNGCAWKDGLFEEVQADYEYGEQLIEKYSYEILEELTLED